VGKLTRLLKHKSDHQRREAARQLGDLGHAAAKAVSALLKALAEDADADVRTRSAETLGKIGVATPAVVTALTAKLTDSKPALKLAAATALARLRQLSPTALELLLPELNLNKTGPETARELIALLGPCGASAAGATTALVPLTTHADVQLRTWTVWALGQIGTGGAALLTALHDPHPRVAAWALGAAFRVARTEFDPLPCLERLVPCPQVEVARALADAVELIGPAATELLARLAALDDPTFRTASELIRQQTGPFAPALKLEDEESLSDDDDDDDDDYDSDMDDMDSDY
jgi:HEAT repeat protein